MEQLKRVQTLVGIAAVSAGSGLLLHLVLPSITQQRKFFLLSVVLLVFPKMKPKQLSGSSWQRARTSPMR